MVAGDKLSTAVDVSAAGTIASGSSTWDTSSFTADPALDSMHCAINNNHVVYWHKVYVPAAGACSFGDDNTLAGDSTARLWSGPADATDYNSLTSLFGDDDSGGNGKPLLHYSATAAGWLYIEHAMYTGTGSEKMVWSIPAAPVGSTEVHSKGKSSVRIAAGGAGGQSTQLHAAGRSSVSIKAIGPGILRVAGSSQVGIAGAYVPAPRVSLPAVEFQAVTRFQGGAVRVLPVGAVTADNPVTLMLHLAGALELAPPILDVSETEALQRRVMPAVAVTMPTPAIIEGRPMLPAYWGRLASSMRATQGPTHIHAIADPDPKWDPAHDGWYNPPPPSGAGDARWTANSLPDPAAFRGGMYWLGEPSAADNTIGITAAAQQWNPDGSTPSAPPWRSIYPFKPSVWNHVHYGEGGRILTISRGVRFNLQFVEHMWLDFGADHHQPFTWAMVGIVMDFPYPSYTHTLLDMGRDPRAVGFPSISDTQAEVNDYVINDGGSYRNLLAVNRSQMLMATDNAPGAGHVLRTPFNPAPKPRMFFGVYNGDHSLVGNYSRDAGKLRTAGKLANTGAQHHRFYVMGRQKGRISQDAASHLVVFEIRYWSRALTAAELDEQYGQLSSTWKFGEYR